MDDDGQVVRSPLDQVGLALNAKQLRRILEIVGIAGGLEEGRRNSRCLARETGLPRWLPMQTWQAFGVDALYVRSGIARRAAFEAACGGRTYHKFKNAPTRRVRDIHKMRSYERTYAHLTILIV